LIPDSRYIRGCAPRVDHHDGSQEFADALTNGQ
jgi:hypothetical protein